MTTEELSAAPVPQLAQVLIELQQLHRELIEQRLLRRADGRQRVRDAAGRLGELSSTAGLIRRAAEELGESSDFDAVVISRIEDTWLTPVAVWSAVDPGETGSEPSPLIGRSVRLAYPLVEAEVAQRRVAAIVSVSENGPRSLTALSGVLRWDAYVVAAIELDGKAAALVHGGRIRDHAAIDDIDLEIAALYADRLGHSLERAVLRETLKDHRLQLRSAAQWMSSQLLRLESDQTPNNGPEVQADGEALLQTLTPREREVLALIGRGLSNRAIAGSLMLGEGTVKYHVKNLLRKLQASSRSEAVSRIARLQAPPGS